MTICTSDTRISEATNIADRLEAIGFCPSGARRYERRGLTVSPGRDFWTISAPAKSDEKLLEGQLGKPGLWKLVDRHSGRGDDEPGWEFHLPAAIVNSSDLLENPADESGADGDMLAACLTWAETSFAEEVNSAWLPPTTAQLEKWIGKDRLTVQAGPIVRQAVVVNDRRRLAVRFPLVYQTSGQLSAARRSWLQATLAEAQNRWMMARVGYRSADSDQAMPAICAELDLTGAPEAALECLLKTGVDGLRWVVSWLLWPVGFLSDPSVACSVWEIPPERAFGPNRDVRKGESHA